MINFKEVNRLQKEAKNCLGALLDLEKGLTPTELKWVERFSKIKDRLFSKVERQIIVQIYDRRCT